jgi:predicted amidohydrolase
MVRGLALRGADLVAVPTALMQPYGFVARVLAPARAYESQVYLAYANRCGHEGSLDYVGESCILAPDGTALARAGTGAEMITATLDPVRLAASRATYTYLKDRMPTHYDPHPP